MGSSLSLVGFSSGYCRADAVHKQTVPRSPTSLNKLPSFAQGATPAFRHLGEVQSLQSLTSDKPSAGSSAHVSLSIYNYPPFFDMRTNTAFELARRWLDDGFDHVRSKGAQFALLTGARLTQTIHVAFCRGLHPSCASICPSSPSLL